MRDFSSLFHLTEGHIAVTRDSRGIASHLASTYPPCHGQVPRSWCVGRKRATGDFSCILFSHFIPRLVAVLHFHRLQAACGAPSAISTYTQRSHGSSSSSSSSINSSFVSLSTWFSRATYTQSPSVATVHNRPRHSIFCSFFHFPHHHPRRFSSFSSFSCLLFLSSPMTRRILLAPSASTSTLQTSFRLISFTYSSPLPTVRLTVLPRLRSRDTPSSVSSLRSFVTTQRAHLIRIIRAISVFPTRPPGFFVVAPPRARVLSKAQQASNVVYKTRFRKIFS